MDLSKIKAFAFDVDGVMTDGGLLCDLNGELYRTFNAKDGFGVRMARLKGYPVGIITGARSRTIVARALTFGVPEEDVYLHSRDKIEDFGAFCSSHALLPEEVLYMGDDVPDIAVIEAAGVGAAPSDAVSEVLAAADFVSAQPGGRGAVREAIETVMRSQGTWTFDVQGYKSKF